MENEIIYSFKASFKDVLENGSDELKEFYSKLSNKEKKEFINKNSRSASKGFEFGLCDPISDVISTVASLLESDLSMVIKSVNEGAISERGRTDNGSIEMTLSINGYDVNYTNENGGYEGKEGLSLEEAEGLYSDLCNKYPECT